MRSRSTIAPSRNLKFKLSLHADASPPADGLSARPDLVVVMPVFNEAAALPGVLREWIPVLQEHAPNFSLLAIDDGSTDSTPEVLRALSVEIGSRLQVLRHENIGHGQSCLRGYREAIALGAPWVFQIDSDGQCDPQFFPAVWQQREDCEVVYGVREVRDDGGRRVLASLILRWLINLVFGVRCADANVPYRLMRTAILPPYLECIPDDFVLANVALAVLLSRDPGIKEGRVPIQFRERVGGEPSVPLRKFGFRALELVRQTSALLRANPRPKPA